MTVLTVAQTTDFSAANLTGTTGVTFTNAFRFVTATFGAGQIGSQLAPTLAVTGSAGTNTLRITGSAATLDLSGWTFANWAATDRVTILAGTGNHTIIGSIKADIITGNTGIDRITGGLGADMLSGGAGNDIFIYAKADTASADTVDGGADTDSLQVSGVGTFDLRFFTITNVENLIFATPSGGISMFLRSAQIGQPGGLSAVFSNDETNVVIVEGTGIDLSTVALINWKAGSDFTDLRATAAGTVTGSAHDDKFSDSGQGSLNMLGGAGNDVFVYQGNGGAAGLDSLAGGIDTDTILLDTISAASTMDFSQATITDVERLVFTDNNPVTALFTNLQLQAGLTTVQGGNTSRLTIQMTAAGGSFSAKSLDLVAWTSDDRVTLQGSALSDTLIGSDFADSISGGLGDDQVKGGAGADTMSGSSGIDTLSYFNATAAVVIDLGTNAATGGTATGDVIDGFENVTGGNGADQLKGSAAANLLTGSAGADSLTGGAGADTLAGGGGADRFIYAATTDSTVGAGRDVISAFVQGADRINLAAIDAITGGAQDAFTFVGTGALGVAGTLRFDQVGSQTRITGDVNGDQTADFEIALTGLFTLVAADFLL